MSTTSLTTSTQHTLDECINMASTQQHQQYPQQHENTADGMAHTMMMMMTRREEENAIMTSGAHIVLSDAPPTTTATLATATMTMTMTANSNNISFDSPEDERDYHDSNNNLSNQAQHQQQPPPPPPPPLPPPPITSHHHHHHSTLSSDQIVGMIAGTSSSSTPASPLLSSGQVIKKGRFNVMLPPTNDASQQLQHSSITSTTTTTATSFMTNNTAATTTLTPPVLLDATSRGASTTMETTTSRMVDATTTTTTTTAATPVVTKKGRFVVTTMPIQGDVVVVVGTQQSLLQHQEVSSTTAAVASQHSATAVAATTSSSTAAAAAALATMESTNHIPTTAAEMSTVPIIPTTATTTTTTTTTNKQDVIMTGPAHVGMATTAVEAPSLSSIHHAPLPLPPPLPPQPPQQPPQPALVTTTPVPPPLVNVRPLLPSSAAAMVQPTTVIMTGPSTQTVSLQQHQPPPNIPPGSSTLAPTQQPSQSLLLPAGQQSMVNDRTVPAMPTPHPGTMATLQSNIIPTTPPQIIVSAAVGQLPPPQHTSVNSNDVMAVNHHPLMTTSQPTTTSSLMPATSTNTPLSGNMAMLDLSITSQQQQQQQQPVVATSQQQLTVASSLPPQQQQQQQQQPLLLAGALGTATHHHKPAVSVKAVGVPANLQQHPSSATLVTTTTTTTATSHPHNNIHSSSTSSLPSAALQMHPSSYSPTATDSNLLVSAVGNPTMSAASSPDVHSTLQPPMVDCASLSNNANVNTTSNGTSRRAPSHASGVPKPPTPTGINTISPPVGFGKILFYLEQMKLEVTEADGTTKSLQRDLKLMRDKNKELEAKNRELERKLNDEKVLREAAESKARSLRRKYREWKETIVKTNSRSRIYSEDDLEDSFHEEVNMELLTDEAKDKAQPAMISALQQHGRSLSVDESSIPLKATIDGSETLPMKPLYEKRSTFECVPTFHVASKQEIATHRRASSYDSIESSKGSPDRKQIARERSTMPLSSTSGKSATLPPLVRSSSGSRKNDAISWATTTPRSNGMMTSNFDPLRPVVSSSVTNTLDDGWTTVDAASGNAIPMNRPVESQIPRSQQSAAIGHDRGVPCDNGSGPTSPRASTKEFDPLRPTLSQQEQRISESGTVLSHSNQAPVMYELQSSQYQELRTNPEYSYPSGGSLESIRLANAASFQPGIAASVVSSFDLTGTPQQASQSSLQYTMNGSIGSFPPPYLTPGQPTAAPNNSNVFQLHTQHQTTQHLSPRQQQRTTLWAHQQSASTPALVQHPTALLTVQNQEQLRSDSTVLSPSAQTIEQFLSDAFDELVTSRRAM